MEKQEIDNSGRKYDKEVPKYGDVMTIENWIENVQDGGFLDDDGFGYWVKDGKMCSGEVFSTLPEDATHVVWFNK